MSESLPTDLNSLKHPPKSLIQIAYMIVCTKPLWNAQNILGHHPPYHADGVPMSGSRN